MSNENKPDWIEEINALLKQWRQGDYVLGEQWFVYRFGSLVLSLWFEEAILVGYFALTFLLLIEYTHKSIHYGSVYYLLFWINKENLL